MNGRGYKERHRMSTRFALFSVTAILAFARICSANPPGPNELDVPLDAVLVRTADVFVTCSDGIYRANRKAKQWNKLTLPAEMPIGGLLGTVPAGSPHILYHNSQARRLEDGQKPGIYHSSDDGQTWKLLAEGYDYGPVALLDNDALFAATNASRRNGKAQIGVSRDFGRTWWDISKGTFGEFYRLFPDPDHPGLICIEANSVRNYIFQAADETYEWKATRSWDWHPERLEGVRFGRSYSTHVNHVPLYMLRATLRNYFDHAFEDRISIPAIDLATAGKRFVFRIGEPVRVPVQIRFLEDMRMREKLWEEAIAAGRQVGELKPTIVTLLDHDDSLDVWGLRVEFDGKRTPRRPAVTTAVHDARQADFQARMRGEPGRGEQGERDFLVKLRSQTEWKKVQVSADAPYRRTIDLDKLHDFSAPGEYRVQLDYDDSWLVDSGKEAWGGTFGSDVFTVVIE
jgi:hypothetical protein